MVSVPSEQGVERSLLSWLYGVGWETHGQDGGRGANVLDETYDRDSKQIVYWNLLAEQLVAINDDLDEDDVDRFVSSLKRDLDAENLMDGNQAFHEILTKGKQFDVRHSDGTEETVYVDLIDFEHPENNRFHAVNQFSVSRGTTIRPDVTLFVNGIPIVQMELKSLAQDNDYYDAITDLQNYEEQVPRLFVPGLLNVAADTKELRYGAVGADRGFYEPWNNAPEEYEHEDPMRQGVQALLNPETLLDVLKHFVFYERKAGGTAKIVPRYMQYYAVKELLDRVEEGDPVAGELHKGLIWHTQGSGKSFTMLFAAENLLSRDILVNPQVFVVVDTDKLNGQMHDQLSNLSLGQWTEADSIDHLQQLIEEGRSGVVLTTIQKFQDVEPDAQGNDEAVVMSDEAHRFMEANLGSRLEAALPDSYHFGFTGTPVREGDGPGDRNTFDEFSPEGERYLHRYSIKDGIQDDVIESVYFTLRHEMEWDIEEAELDEHWEREMRGLTPEEKREFIKENVTTRTMAEIRPRVQAIADEIDRHYSGQVEPNGWKGMVVTPSRRSAAMYGEELQERRSDEEIEVLYTTTNDDPDVIQQFHTDPEQREDIVEDFQDEENPKLLVVHNMLLTGFDAPILKTMYLDRNLRNHTLLQAIARTNRPAEGKEGGEIVDFQGVFENVDDALDYDAETRAYAARDKDELFEHLVEQTEEMLALFEDVPKGDSQEVVRQALDVVGIQPEKRKFKQGMRELQDLYEAVAPDGRIVTEGVEEDYAWLTRIHTAFKRDQDREDDPTEAMREKTREVLNEHVDIGEIKRDFPVYEIGEEHLEAIEGMDSPVQKATSIAHATRDHLRPKTGQNPRYERLSERVNAIVEEWERDQRSDPEAVEALREVEEQVLETEEEAAARGEAEYAIFLELTEERDSPLPENEAEEMATDIVDEFEERVDREYRGWATNDTTEQEIEVLLLDVLLKDYDRSDLIDDEFMDNVRRYLIENYV